MRKLILLLINLLAQLGDAASFVVEMRVMEEHSALSDSEDGEVEPQHKNPLVCEFCGKLFPKSSKFQRHLRSHTGERPYVCLHPGCGKTFRRSDHLRRHECVHSGDKQFVCDVEGCNKAFYEPSHLKRHKEAHLAPKVYTCSSCGEEFRKKTQLRQHRLTAHNEAEFECPHVNCGKIFMCQSKLDKHMLSHTEQRFVCAEPDCMSVFTRRCDLHRHMMAHQRKDEQGGDVACTYPGCDKTFKHRKNMLAHVRASHETEKRFVCSVAGCGQSFGYKHVLDRHVQHIHLNPKPKKQKMDEQARVWEVLTGFALEQMDSAMQMASPDAVTVSCEI